MKRLSIPAPGPCLQETLADLDRIIGMKQAVLRNLWITSRYHILSQGLSEVVTDRDANWSTFATWASLTAGESIRNEEVPRFILDALSGRRRFEERLPAPLRAVLRWFGIGFVERLAQKVLQSVSEQVADGNRKVFEELAPLFAHFIDMMRRSPTQEGLEEFLDTLTVGPVKTGGQDLLREAFTAYFKAKQSAEPLRSQYILLANCKIGLHEQTRLQDNIEGAMDAPLDVVFGQGLRDELPFLRPLTFALERLTRRALGLLRDDWQRLLTRYAMNLSLPGGKEIPLGEDLPEHPKDVHLRALKELPGGERPTQSFGEFPTELDKLTLPELVVFAKLYDDNLESKLKSGANNWADLRDRMGFIVELFRAYQKDEELFVPPLTEHELDVMAQGRVPDPLSYELRRREWRARHARSILLQAMGSEPTSSVHTTGEPPTSEGAPELVKPVA